MAPAKKKSSDFTDAEKAAMKERAEEIKREKRGAGEAEDLKAVVEKIAAMTGKDKDIASRIHELVLAAAPELKAKLWYGMPAYYKNGKNICFFQDAGKFKARYSTFGFNDAANLDDGDMWAASFAILKLSAADEARITKLVKQAVS
ncbi:MAG: iron chaperone [Devosia sp.]